MEGYVQQALQELEHVLVHKKHLYAPSKVARPDYGATVQYAHDDEGEPISESRIRRIERIVGKFLYYARAIDTNICNML